MSAIDYYVGVWKKYADFSGRARRSEYWYFALFHLLAFLAAMVIDLMIGYSIFYFLYLVASIIPSLAVSARRLHDTDRSGWWLLISIIPFIGSIVIFIFAVTNGNAGSNQYGSDPKNPDDLDDITAHLVD